MPIPLAVPLILSGISALSGLFGNRKKKQEQTSNTTSTQNTDRTTSTNNLEMPEYTPGGRQLLDSLLAKFTNRTNESPEALADSLNTSSLQSINQGSDIKRKVLESILASRGLSGSAIGANQIKDLESSRVGEQVNTLGRTPQLIEQILKDRLSTASNFLSSLPVGRRTTGESREIGTVTGNSNTTGTLTTPADKLGGLFGGAGIGLAPALAGLYGSRNNVETDWYKNLRTPWDNLNSPEYFTPRYK